MYIVYTDQHASVRIHILMHAYALSYPGIHTFNVYTCTHTHTHARTHNHNHIHTSIQKIIHIFTYTHLHTQHYVISRLLFPPARAPSVDPAGHPSTWLGRRFLPCTQKGIASPPPKYPGRCGRRQISITLAQPEERVT